MFNSRINVWKVCLVVIGLVVLVEPGLVLELASIGASSNSSSGNNTLFVSFVYAESCIINTTSALVPCRRSVYVAINTCIR